MAQKPYDDDTEYHLHDEEGGFDEGDIYEHESSGTPEPEPSADKKKRSFKPKRKLILFVIIALVAVFIIYKLFSAFFEEAPQQVQKKPIQAKTALLSAPAQAVTPTVSKTKRAVSAVKATAKQAAKVIARVPVRANGRISALKKGQTELKNLLIANKNENKQNLASLDGKISELTGNIENLHGSVRIVSTQTQHNASALQKLATQRKVEEKQRDRQIRQTKRYFVKAVIPGRAWLQGADGSTMTVAVGNNISGYGIVKAINPYNGVVKINTGANIYYGISNK